MFSQFRKKEVQDKEGEPPGAASVKAVRRGMWRAGLGGSLAVQGSSVSEPVDKEKEGVVVSDVVSAAAGGY